VQLFLMLVFNALLFPTDSDKIAGLDYLMCARLSDVPKLNWCQAIVDDIKVKARDLNDNIASNDGPIPNVQGCLAFLVVSFCQLFLVFFVSAIYYICCSIFLGRPFSTIFHFRSAISCLGQPFHVYVTHFIFYRAFNVLSAILHTLLAIPSLGQPFYTASAIFILYQPFPWFVHISFYISHFNFLSYILYLLSVIFWSHLFFCCMTCKSITLKFS
jgi:hypothetical protein